VAWIVLLARKALTAEYLHTNVEPTDPFWGILERWFRLPDHVRRAVFDPHPPTRPRPRPPPNGPRRMLDNIDNTN